MHLYLRRFPALGGLQLFALLCAMMAGTSSLHAGTITVTTTADSGAGSLRSAIAAASDGDTIQFDAALNGQSITLTSDELAINKNITLDGPGADQLAVTRASGGTPDFRIFHVLPGHTVIIEGLTISGGSGGPGSGVANDSATVVIDRCVVQDCSASSFGGGVYVNAAAFVDANLTVLNSTIRTNHAEEAAAAFTSWLLHQHAWSRSQTAS